MSLNCSHFQHQKTDFMSYFILDKKGNMYYEAGSLEEALQNCPPGYTIRVGNEL